MRPGHQILTLLRQQPGTTVRSWGFVVRGADLNFSGRCTVRCQRHLKPGAATQHSSVYELNVTPVGLDWYFPYQADRALSCLVPFGQPNGTLVLTYGMNGCALEVRQEAGGNRFFHDADGISMPPGGGGKFRAEYEDYAGPDDTTRTRAQRFLNPDSGSVGNFEHCLISIKEDDTWHVFSSAVLSQTKIAFMEFHAWQVKDRVPYHLGSFSDRLEGPQPLTTTQRQARRDGKQNRTLFPSRESPV